MKTSTPCTCHSEPDACGSGVLERPRYFPRQLLTPAELTLEQQYFRDKLRRHNRLMHGWGVVCGAEVCLVPEPPSPDPNQPPPQPQPWKVCVKPGYALGPYGDEILIDCERIVDLRTFGLTGQAGECGEPVDPWCADVFIQRDPGPLFVAVRYKELQSRPVRVQPAGCGCDETQCEYSRWRDGYEIGILPRCPTTHEDPPDLEQLFRGPLPGCPECPADPWVVLARVELDRDGTITGIDNCACRRLVISFGPFWWQCGAARPAPPPSPPPQRELTVTLVRGGTPQPGTTFVLAAETTESFPDAVEAGLGAGVTVASAVVSADHARVTITATVQPNAATGARNLVIRDAATHEVFAEKQEAIKVAPAGQTGGGGGMDEKKPTRGKTTKEDGK